MSGTHEADLPLNQVSSSGLARFPGRAALPPEPAETKRHFISAEHGPLGASGHRGKPHAWPPAAGPPLAACTVYGLEALSATGSIGKPPFLLGWSRNRACVSSLATGARDRAPWPPPDRSNFQRHLSRQLPDRRLADYPKGLPFLPVPAIQGLLLRPKPYAGEPRLLPLP